MVKGLRRAQHWARPISISGGCAASGPYGSGMVLPVLSGNYRAFCNVFRGLLRPGIEPRHGHLALAPDACSFCPTLLLTVPGFIRRAPPQRTAHTGLRIRNGGGQNCAAVHCQTAWGGAISPAAAMDRQYCKKREEKRACLTISLMPSIWAGKTRASASTVSSYIPGRHTGCAWRGGIDLPVKTCRRVRLSDLPQRTGALGDLISSAAYKSFYNYLVVSGAS